MKNMKNTDKLYVQMFARFAVSGMGGILDEDSIRSEMLTRLFAYISCHRKKEITIQELVEVLWHDEESDNPAGALKNLVYRLRTMLKKQWPDYEFIRTGRGSYKWNDELPVIIDAEEFEACCEAATREKDVREKIELYKKAIHLYKGMFLPKLSSEYWVASLSTYYHSLYLSAVKAAAQLFEQSKQYKEMGQICNYALQLDTLDENLHCCFIRALMHQNKLKLAVEQYKKAADVLYENLGVTPSAELRAVYDELMKQTHEEEKNISTIQQELDEEGLSGAFLCEYGVFKKTYQLEKRRSERLGISVYFSLITVEPTLNIKKDSQAYLNIIAEGMEHLESTLLSCLRSGDVISRYSGTQYVILLPTCQYETARLVMSRIEQLYGDLFKKKAKTRLQYSLNEMDFGSLGK